MVGSTVHLPSRTVKAGWLPSPLEPLRSSWLPPAKRHHVRLGEWGDNLPVWWGGGVEGGWYIEPSILPETETELRSTTHSRHVPRNSLFPLSSSYPLTHSRILDSSNHQSSQSFHISNKARQVPPSPLRLFPLRSHIQMAKRSSPSTPPATSRAPGTPATSRAPRTPSRGHIWTPSEDATIIRLHTSIPSTRWAAIASELGSGLTANAVRLRFQRYLKFRGSPTAGL